MSNNLLKLIKNEICESVTLIINQSLTTGIFPNKLKLQKLYHFLKKVIYIHLIIIAPFLYYRQYRKSLKERCTIKYTTIFKTMNYFITASMDFEQNHSTELATLEIIDRIIQDMDKYNTPINIYIDLSKAFDTIDHNILLCKLKYYGLWTKRCSS